MSGAESSRRVVETTVSGMASVDCASALLNPDNSYVCFTIHKTIVEER